MAIEKRMLAVLIVILCAVPAYSGNVTPAGPVGGHQSGPSGSQHSPQNSPSTLSPSTGPSRNATPAPQSTASPSQRPTVSSPSPKHNPSIPSRTASPSTTNTRGKVDAASLSEYNSNKQRIDSYYNKQVSDLNKSKSSLSADQYGSRARSIESNRQKAHNYNEATLKARSGAPTASNYNQPPPTAPQPPTSTKTTPSGLPPNPADKWTNNRQTTLPPNPADKWSNNKQSALPPNPADKWTNNKQSSLPPNPADKWTNTPKGPDSQFINKWTSSKSQSDRYFEQQRKNLGQPPIGAGYDKWKQNERSLIEQKTAADQKFKTEWENYFYRGTGLPTGPSAFTPNTASIKNSPNAAPNLSNYQGKDAMSKLFDWYRSNPGQTYIQNEKTTLSNITSMRQQELKQLKDLNPINKVSQLSKSEYIKWQDAYLNEVREINNKYDAMVKDYHAKNPLPNFQGRTALNNSGPQDVLNFGPPTKSSSSPKTSASELLNNMIKNKPPVVHTPSPTVTIKLTKPIDYHLKSPGLEDKIFNGVFGTLDTFNLIGKAVLLDPEEFRKEMFARGYGESLHTINYLVNDPGYSAAIGSMALVPVGVGFIMSSPFVAAAGGVVTAVSLANFLGRHITAQDLDTAEMNVVTTLGKATPYGELVGYTSPLSHAGTFLTAVTAGNEWLKYGMGVEPPDLIP